MKDKITIGLFIDTYFPMIDGVTMVVDNYARRLNEYANVIVFAPKCFRKKFDDNKLPYKIIRCKSLGMPIIDYSLPIPDLDRKFIKKLNDCKLDLVHIHSPATLGKVGINYAKKNNISVIATMHSQYRKDIKRAVKIDKLAGLINKVLINKTFNKCDECWAVNSEVAKIFYADYKYKTMPIVMNNATEMEPVKDIDRAKELIDKMHNINEAEKVFLFVGRLNALKNIFLIVDSLKIIKDTCPNFRFKMLFVGNGQDEEKLKEYINKNNMKNEILMCGRVTDRELLANYYARADLFLFPSLYDASSIVQIESASQKTPGLFIKGAATTATIENNKNGFLSENNPEEYAKKILEIMDNKKLYEEVCENCFNDLYKNWDDTIKEVYERYLSFIKDVKDDEKGENNVRKY